MNYKCNLCNEEVLSHVKEAYRHIKNGQATNYTRKQEIVMALPSDEVETYKPYWQPS